MTDFGLARPLETDVSLTGDGRVVGTLAYLAPEVLRGQPATAQSDMYSLGVCLVELLTGERPGRNDSEPARDVSEALRGRGESIQVTAVLTRLLSAEPGARYPDHGALARDLEQASHAFGAVVTAEDVADRSRPSP